MPDPITHVVIPDTQIEPGDPTDMMGWIGSYIVEHLAGRSNVKIIHLGDHAAMNSLSVHNSPQEQQGMTYEDDINSANVAWSELNAALVSYNKKRKAYKEKKWNPEKHILIGNHENHIDRAVANDPRLVGKLRLSDLDYERSGWTVHPFLKVLQLDGVNYSHFFVNNSNGRAISGMIETRIKSIGASFVQGHQQGLKVGMVETIGGRRRGIVAGSCYLKSEGYRGPQAMGEWRGILVLHQVREGDYDLMEVSLDYLCRRYEGVPVAQFVQEKYDMEWAG